jgi:hypothetical protein
MFTDYIKAIYAQIHSSQQINLDINNNDQLLLNCAKINADLDRIRDSLNANLDWNYILETSIEHRIAPLIYYNLEKVASDKVPADTMKTLRGTYNATLARNILALNQLTSILKALSDANIEVIILKGAALAETIYPNIALRPFCDIDLLIHKEDFPIVEATLSQIGYSLPWDFLRNFIPQFGNEIHYEKGDEVLLDIHWHIVPFPHSKYMPIQHLWKTPIKINIDGIDAFVLSPEMLLIHLCLHTSKEYCYSLLQLVDISEVIFYYGDTLDWELILERVLLYKVHFPFHYLHIVKELFDVPIPSFVLEQLSVPKASFFNEHVYNILADPKVSNIKWAIAQFLMLDGVKSKSQFVTGKFFPEKEFMQKKYQCNNVFGSYYLRWREALQGGMKALLQTFRRNRG